MHMQMNMQGHEVRQQAAMYVHHLEVWSLLEMVLFLKEK